MGKMFLIIVAFVTVFVILQQTTGDAGVSLVALLFGGMFFYGLYFMLREIFGRSVAITFLLSLAGIFIVAIVVSVS